MKDFTIKIYEQLLTTLISNEFVFLTIEDYFSSIHPLSEPFILMRHDVDRKPQNSLRMAKLEAKLGIKATYYFRIITKTFKPNIIKEIANLGHEIGYHYENLTTANSQIKNVNPVKYSRSSNFTGQECKIKNEEEYKEKLFELAIKDFEKNLNRLREIVPIKNICMHGSPLSKWDNRMLWDKYDYRDFGITSEPYFDIDYNKVFYITDTGRQWNNQTSSIRDNVSSNFDIKIKNTKDLINKIENGELPDKIMMNVHPQRWTDKALPWLKELIWQNVKNVVKRFIIKR